MAVCVAALASMQSVTYRLPGAHREHATPAACCMLQ